MMTFTLLVLAAVMEVGGDALMRNGLHAQGMTRIAFLSIGVLVLSGYGLLVNLSPLDFGRALGVYVTIFYIVAQIVNWLGYAIQPTVPVLVGGALICAGGVVLATWP